MHPQIEPRGPGRRGFPRARGDAPRIDSRKRERLMVSPRARGCTLIRIYRPEVRDGFPARAGMHPSESVYRWGRSRFPRARGDAPAPA